MVMGGTTRRGLLGREQPRNARPSGIGQDEDGLAEDPDRERALRVGLLARPPRCVAASSNRLVPAAKG